MCVTLKEPIVAHILVATLAQHSVWAPVDSVLQAMSNESNAPSLGFTLEQVIACLLIPHFSAAMTHLRSKNEFSKIPEWATALG